MKDHCILHCILATALGERQKAEQAGADVNPKNTFDVLYSRIDFHFVGECVSSGQENRKWQKRVSRLSVRGDREYSVPGLASNVIRQKVIEVLLDEVLGIVPSLVE